MSVLEVRKLEAAVLEFDFECDGLDEVSELLDKHLVDPVSNVHPLTLVELSEDGNASIFSRLHAAIIAGGVTETQAREGSMMQFLLGKAKP